MPRRNIYLPDELDERIIEYMEQSGINRSQLLQRGAVLYMDHVKVYLVGELSEDTTPDEFREFERKAKGE